VSDGGHRLIAAIERGDTDIPVLIPKDSYEHYRNKLEVGK
jgi:ParB-like chromosome segregation protein Spo0J